MSSHNNHPADPPNNNNNTTTTTITTNADDKEATPTPPTRIRGSIVAHLDTSTPAINASPVEIDGTPTSPDRVRMSRAGSWSSSGGGGGGGGGGGNGAAAAAAARRGSRAAGTGTGTGVEKQGSSPDHLTREEEVLEEFGLIDQGGENRAALLQSRKRDPAVLVDIPQGPSVEDFAAAGLLSPDAEDKKVEPAR